VNPRLNRFHLRHFDPVITRADAHAVVTGLLPVLTLERRVTRWELWIKEGLEGFIEIDARLLECDGVEISEPVIFAGLLRHRQQGFEVFLGFQPQAVALVLRADYVQCLVVHKPGSTELAVKKFRLLGCRVDAYFCGLQHFGAHRYNSAIIIQKGHISSECA